MKKVDDFSMIELEGVINEFIAGGKRHSQAQEIYTKVDEMLKKLCLLCVWCGWIMIAWTLWVGKGKPLL